MPLPGGAADKAGNRFERWWTIRMLLDVLAGRAESLQVEVPGKDGVGAEFRVVVDGAPYWHQVKRQRSNGPWTIASLHNEGVVGPWWEKLGTGGRIVFVSGTSADELEELVDRATRAASWVDFRNSFQDSKSQQERFDRLCKAWVSRASFFSPWAAGGSPR